MLQCNTYLFFSLYKNQPNIWQFIINLYFFRKRASLVTTIFLVIGLQNYLSPLPAICVQHSFFGKSIVITPWFLCFCQDLENFLISLKIYFVRDFHTWISQLKANMSRLKYSLSTLGLGQSNLLIALS